MVYYVRNIRMCVQFSRTLRKPRFPHPKARCKLAVRNMPFWTSLMEVMGCCPGYKHIRSLTTNSMYWRYGERHSTDMIENGIDTTLSPLDFGMMCTASQCSSRSLVITQPGPSRAMMLVRKPVMGTLDDKVDVASSSWSLRPSESIR